MRILPIWQTPSVLPQGGNPAPSQGSLPSLSLRDISPKGRDKFGLRETKAFLSEEGGAAQAATEGAAREQVCMRVFLIRQMYSPHRLLGSPLGRAGICEAND